MIDYIADIKNLLKDCFAENWFQVFDNEEISENDEIVISFRENINKIRVQIFQKLSASILVGEYCKSGGLSIHLKDIQDSLQSIPIPTPPNAVVEEIFQEALINNFIEAIKVGITLYRTLTISVERRFKFDNRRLIHYSNPKLTDILEKESFDDVNNNELKFLQYNIAIAYFDIELKPSTDDYHRLESLRQRISEGNNIYTPLLIQKCDFLIAKWIFRQEHTYNVPVYSIIDNEEVEIDVDTYKKDNPILSHWRKYIESHYELSRNWKSEIEKSYVQNKGLNYKDLELGKLHRFIKYYKDVNKNFSELTVLRKEIENRFNSAKKSDSEYYKYCYAIALTYAYNNEFSLLLELHPQKEEEISKLYDEILLIQSKTTIKNFFPQYKYLELLVGKLEALYSSRKALEFVTPARKIIDTCESIIKTYKDNVDWSKLKYNYVFQLPYDESLINLDSHDLPHLHIFSTFLLPINREKYVNEFDEFKQRVSNLKTSIEVFENVEPEIKEFGALKQDIKDRDLKSIEIIGIFTSIVTFIAGSIPSFKYIETAYQAGLFMFALSSSLSLFILLILSITRGIERIRRNSGLIWFLVGIGIIFWILLVLCTKDPQKAESAILKSRFDSLTRKSDSLEQNIKSVNEKYDSVLKKIKRNPSTSVR